MGKGDSTEKDSSKHEKHRHKDTDRKHKKRRKHDDNDDTDRHRKQRRILDEREGRRGDLDRDEADTPSHFSKDGEKRLMFTDVGRSGESSRSSSFRRPGGMPESNPSTPSPPSGLIRGLANKRLDSLRLPSQAGSPLAQSHTPIPSVMTPSATSSSLTRALSPSSLNKLQAKVLRAKLMGMPDAEKLEKEYEVEARKVHGTEEGGVRTKVEVLPTLDARGRMYDVGHGKDDGQTQAGNRKKKEKVGSHNISHLFIQ